MNHKIREAIEQVANGGLTEVPEIIDALSERGFDPAEVVGELAEMVGPEVHREDRHSPTPADLAQIRALRNRMETHD